MSLWENVVRRYGCEWYLRRGSEHVRVPGESRCSNRAETQIRSLESLGVKGESYSNLLTPILLKQIPSELVLEFNRSQKDEGFDLSALLRFLHLEIRSRERASQINSHKPCHYSPPPQERTKNKGSYFPRQHMKPPPNRVHLRPHSFPTPWEKVQPRNRKCLYCNKGHELDTCCSFSAHEKREILRKKGCCFLCLSPGHRAMECVKRESCPICNGSHHFSICFRNRHDDDLSPKRDTDNIVSAVIKTDYEDILTMSVIVNESNISKQLSEFWNLENLGIEAEVSDEENIDNDIMSEFEAGISYQNKRYKVKFPWKPNMKTLLENNEEVARKRFLKLRSRFKNDSSLFEDYKLVVNNYLSEKIIERVPFEEENLKHNNVYLPHRAVIRTDKTTSKLRIVFDTSSHAKSQLSLKDCLHTGLNFIPNLFFLLIKFRVNPIAFVANIKMAFLMIEIDESERDFTRFFWDENPGIDLENKRLDIFRMTRVLFGVKSSPFLLAATIKHHPKKYVDIFPDTFNHLNQSLYIDDFLCGNVSVQTALTTCIESKQILEDASMDLRKWRTNSSELNQRLKNLNFEVDEHKESLNTLIASKVLGVGWNEKSDTFYFDSSDLGTFLSKRINTKIYLLQAAGRLFDPGGRLKHSTLSEFQKHQMMLPKAHHLTDLIIEHYHKKSLHSGLQTTLYLIRQFYWIPSGQNRVRRILNKCITCFRTKTQTINQMMGDLPRDRIVPSRPFEKVGLDYAGPIITKPNLKRSRVTLKSYIAIFICFSTKATHLEVVSDLTTEAFLACLRRFIARRSKPSVIQGDQAIGVTMQRTSREQETFLVNGTKFASPTEFSYLARKRESNGTSFHPLLPISVDCGKQTLSP
ncbi:uncharacterized protein TNCV_530911 [Trichonephila clavipes]|nr:uncharacterized protein TNCV_530911 [Trichonephila clavipes]